jgi:hypothetical protein
MTKEFPPTKSLILEVLLRVLLVLHKALNARMLMVKVEQIAMVLLSLSNSFQESLSLHLVLVLTLALRRVLE